MKKLKINNLDDDFCIAIYRFVPADNIDKLIFTCDGGYVIIADYDQSVLNPNRIIDTSTGFINSLFYNTNKKMLIVGGSSDNSIRVYDLKRNLG